MVEFVMYTNSEKVVKISKNSILLILKGLLENEVHSSVFLQKCGISILVKDDRLFISFNPHHILRINFDALIYIFQRILEDKIEESSFLKAMKIKFQMNSL